MASSIVAPMPMRFTQSDQRSDNTEGNKQGRETPLPLYEKTQTLPFTLNLQEDVQNPGQFQIVVNLAPSQGIPCRQLDPHDSNATKAYARKLSADAAKPPLGTSGSSPTTPQTEKQDWADLDNVPAEFLEQVVPDWNIQFSRNDSTASTHSKKLSDIKARIKKKGKGYVVRLLKGSSGEHNEVAEVDLGHPEVTDDHVATFELDSSSLPVELDSAQASICPASDNALARAGICEIGTSDEHCVAIPQGMEPRDPIRTDTSNVPYFRGLTSSSLARISIAEEGFSDAETLVPDLQSIYGRMESDLDTFAPSHPSRSLSTSSIVKTPTRGLSVVGPVRRVKKNPRIRPRNKTANLELNRSDARKSVKSRSSHVLSVKTSENVMANATLRPANADESSTPSPLASTGYSEGPHQMQSHKVMVREPSSVKAGHSRRSSADDVNLHSRTKLRVQTINLPLPRSTNSSPIVRRRRSPKFARASRSASPTSASDFDEEPSPLAEWMEVKHPEELRKALSHAIGPNMSTSQYSRVMLDEKDLPQIVEPDDDSHVGDISLPPEVEIRSTPLHAWSPSFRYWGLALSALSNKLHQGFRLLQEQYGSERPVPRGHVRVRWTCSCGQHLYDDFIEQRPNAARLLEAYLNRPRAHAPRSPRSQTSTASSISSIFDASSRASTLTTPSSTYSGPSSLANIHKQSRYSPTRVRSNNSFNVRMPSYTQESWLLTCANEGKLTPKVVHIDVNEGRVKSDKDLALALREHHDQLNRQWYSWARLRGLTTIEFVQFEIHRNRFADIRATPSMPPKSATPSTMTSDPEKSTSPSQHPYNFEPNDLLPPVGSTYLLHLFRHPNDYDGELITYLRCPKRRERLEFGMGWGVHLVDGFLAQRVWAFTMAVFGLGSVAFAVMWAIKKDDVQGAFGVAQWVLGIAVLLVGALQAWLE
ncbi:hypothetical protein ACN47E_001599 [Coniothyrium glycines]